MSEPFRLPELVYIEVDWPMPPSVNSIWQRGKRGVYLNPKYRAWKDEVSATCCARRNPLITGTFSADIKLNRQFAARGDLDNRIKPILDGAQLLGLIANDKHCQRITVEWVDAANAPAGCRLILREMVE